MLPLHSGCESIPEIRIYFHDLPIKFKIWFTKCNWQDFPAISFPFNHMLFAFCVYFRYPTWIAGTYLCSTSRSWRGIINMRRNILLPFPGTRSRPCLLSCACLSRGRIWQVTCWIDDLTLYLVYIACEWYRLYIDSFPSPVISTNRDYFRIFLVSANVSTCLVLWWIAR